MKGVDKMKQFRSDNRKGGASAAKRLALALILIVACALMTACYMEPDRVVDAGNALDNSGKQDFQTVITDTPAPTNTPTPAPTSSSGQQMDWSAWTFGDDNATNPPASSTDASGVTATSTPSGGTITVGLTTATPRPSSASATATPKPTTSSAAASSTLKEGSSGSEVKTLQQRLKDLGYYKGSVDGKYGAGTAEAVKAFQRANKLTADGKAGKNTQTALYSKNAVKASATNSSSSSSSSSSGSSTSSSYTNGRTDVYLQIGSSGKQVKILQNRLIVLGYLTGTADGEFGETTEAAVKAFQKRNSIYDDGVAGPTTLTKLYSSSAKKASSVVANLGSIRPGTNGSAVRALQQQLKTLGYYSGSVDGDYGSGTTAAVTAFQQANGLTADGIAGKATQNAIYAAINGGSSSSGGSSSGSSTSPASYGAKASSNGYTTISSTSGSNSSNVKAVQSALSAKGYYNGDYDGSYGSGTEQAVKDFQKAMGLRVTGMAGPTTQRLLYGGTSASGSYSKLQQGDTGSKVKQLQYALYELKYYDGDITGTYDTATTNAVLTFQQVHGLEMDGIAGQQTQQILFSSSAIPCNI